MVTREVDANGGRGSYQAFDAHRRARQCARRPKASKLDQKPLVDVVTAWLEELWSPQEISGRLTVEHPRDPEMHVSHETIYQSLFVQGQGELERELARCLRTERTTPKSQGHVETRGKIKDLVMISERPAEVEDRAVPGHWEGDLIIGAGGRSAVGTLVERTTRYLLLSPPPARGQGRLRGRGSHETRHLDPARRTLPAASPGIRARRWRSTRTSPSPPGSPSSSVIPTRPGSGDPTRTPTGCSANICPRAPISLSTQPRTWSASSGA